VLWPAEGEYFSGTVASFDAAAGTHEVEYDDGDAESLALGKETWAELRPSEDGGADPSEGGGDAAGSPGEEERAGAPAGGRPRRRATGAAKKAVQEARAAARNAISDSEEEESGSGDDSDDSEFEVGAAADEGASEDDDVELESEGGEETEASEEASGLEDSPAKKPARRKGPAAKRAPAARGAAAAGGAGGGSDAPPAPGTPAPAARAPPPPAAGSAARLRASLGVAPGSAAKTEAVADAAGHAAFGVGGFGATADSAQFAARYGEAKFAFLRPDRVRDAQGRRPGEAGYNARTCKIPDGWFKQHKVSAGQEQWWRFKCQNFDSVLMFKMGKFYELFEMDAHVGVEVLGLAYMKGDQPHAGFPEANYHTHAEALARAGLRVVVIEQVETPEQLAERNRERKAQGQAVEKVVRREVVAVITRATFYEPEMLGRTTDATWLGAFSEGPAEGGAVEIGACFVDVATGQVALGQFRDDELRTSLRAHLTAMQPAEVLLPHDRPEVAVGADAPARAAAAAQALPGAAAAAVSETSLRTLRGTLRAPRFECQRRVPGAEAVARLRAGGYFAGDGGADGKAPFPAAVEALGEAGPAGEYAAQALALCHSHLAACLLDRAVFPLGTVERLPAAAAAAGAAGGGSPSSPPHAALDGAALENLEVVENAQGRAEGSLLEKVDNCVTSAGRRLLREWLVRPLARRADIERRQDAVASLLDEASLCVGDARKQLSRVPDLERSLARLSATLAGGGTGRDAAHVVLYEDQGQRKVRMLLQAIRGLSDVARAVESFADVRASVRSELLASLVTPGRAFPDMAGALGEMEAAADWGAAEREGRVVPAAGIDAAYDAAVEGVAGAARALDDYLGEVKGSLGGAVRYASVMSQTHLLEVPDSLEGRVPRDWELAGTRKGFKRYTNADLDGLVRAHDEAERAREAALAGTLSAIVGRFSRSAHLWRAAVACVAQLDALMSLAYAAQDGTSMVRPRILDPESHAPVFRARGLLHPASIRTQGGLPFVPNDVVVGGDPGGEPGASGPPMVLLTGPNMGGKSTLLRQVCLTVLLAQVGAWVPAESVELTPADAVFVRMGARDNIAAGQSTFFVELSETAAMLRRATRHSLVALDELGRGTSTFDGAAIASAVLSHVEDEIGCRGLFATHYHALSTETAQRAAAGRPGARVMHMACRVARPPGEPAAADAAHEVTFLYKLTDGPCPRSYGTHVARLAGLPTSVVNRAAAKASLAEDRGVGAAAADGGAGGGGDEGDVSALVGGLVRAAQSGDAGALQRLWAQCGPLLHD